MSSFTPPTIRDAYAAVGVWLAAVPARGGPSALLVIVIIFAFGIGVGAARVLIRGHVARQLSIRAARRRRARYPPAAGVVLRPRTPPVDVILRSSSRAQPPPETRLRRREAGQEGARGRSPGASPGPHRD